MGGHVKLIIYQNMTIKLTYYDTKKLIRGKNSNSKTDLGST